MSDLQTFASRGTNPWNAAEVLSGILSNNPEIVRHYLLGFTRGSEKLSNLYTEALAMAGREENREGASYLAAYLSAKGFVSPRWGNDIPAGIPARALYMELEQMRFDQPGPLNISNYANVFSRISDLPDTRQDEILDAIADIRPNGEGLKAGLLTARGMSSHRPHVDLRPDPGE